LAWRIEFEDAARKELKNIDRKAQERILKFLRERISPADNPRICGKALKGALGAYWRYRVGDYRLVCRIEDEKVLVLILRVGHRKNVYNF